MPRKSTVSGVPFAIGRFDTRGRFFKLCPACDTLIESRVGKGDGESYTNEEYHRHYAQEHGKE